jgi:hypothetical protein
LERRSAGDGDSARRPAWDWNAAATDRNAAGLAGRDRNTASYAGQNNGRTVLNWDTLGSPGLDPGASELAGQAPNAGDESGRCGSRGRRRQGRPLDGSDAWRQDGDDDDWARRGEHEPRCLPVFKPFDAQRTTKTVAHGIPRFGSVIRRDQSTGATPPIRIVTAVRPA